MRHESGKPDFWNDNTLATTTLKKISVLEKEIELLMTLDLAKSDIGVLLEFAESGDINLNEIILELENFVSKVKDLELKMILGNPKDIQDAIITIHPGAGGTESQDWAQMLYRMYSRWVEKKGFKMDILDFQPGDEAGIKDLTMEIKGDYSYGLLKAEAGVHRLVRISPFDSNNRADCRADVDFYKRLKQAGARLFCVGFESGDDVVLKHMKKNLNLHKVDAFMENTRKAGIMVHGCFMVGNLNETKETLEKTLDLAKRIKPDTAQFFPIMVYPGTEAYREAKEKGYLTTENYSEWLTPDGLHNSVIDLPNVTHKELVEFCDRARKEFYLNPSYIAMKLKQSMFDYNEFKRNVKGFATLSKFLLRGSFGGDDTSVVTSARSLSNNSIKN